MIRVAGGDTSPENVETLVTINPGRRGGGLSLTVTEPFFLPY